jgi:hypothetical protein
LRNVFTMRCAFLVAFALALGFVPARGAVISYQNTNDWGFVGVHAASGGFGLAGTGPSMTVAGPGTYDQVYPVSGGSAEAKVTLQTSPTGFSVSGAVSAPGGGTVFNAVVYIDFTLDQAATLHLDLSDLKNSNGPGLNSAWWQLILNGPTTLGGELAGQKTQPYSGDVAFKGVNDVADGLHGQQPGSSYVMDLWVTASGQQPSTGDFAFSATVVPEPATWSLLLVGAAIVIGRHSTGCSRLDNRTPDRESKRATAADRELIGVG